MSEPPAGSPHDRVPSTVNDAARSPARDDTGRQAGVAISARLVAINAASGVAARLVNVFVLVGLYRYLLERLAPDQFAIYPLVVAVMVFAPLFFSFFTGGVSRYIVEACARGDAGRVRAIVSSITPLLCLAAIVFAAGGLAFAAFIDVVLVIAPGMAGEAGLMLALLVVTFAVQMVLLPFGAGYHVRQRFVELNALNLARDVMRLLVIFALLDLQGPSVLWIVVGTVVAELCHTLVVVVRSRRFVPDLALDVRRFRWELARQLTSFGLWTTLGRLANVLYANAGVLVLNLHGDAVDVTAYYFAAALFLHINSLIMFAREPLQPSMVAMHATADTARLARTTLRGGRYGLWVSMLVACPLAIFSSDFVGLVMGESYAATSTLIILFMLTFPFSQAVGLLPMLAMATARVRAFNVAAVVSTAACLAAMLVAAGPLAGGAVGVTAALAAGTVAAQLLYFWPLNLRLAGVPAAAFIRRVLVPGLAPAACGGAVWLATAALLPVSGWFTLAAAVAPGAIVYIGTLLTACLDEPDKVIAQRLIASVRHLLDPVAIPQSRTAPPRPSRTDPCASSDPFPRELASRRANDRIAP